MFDNLIRFNLSIYVSLLSDLITIKSIIWIKEWHKKVQSIVSKPFQLHLHIYKYSLETYGDSDDDDDDYGRGKANANKYNKGGN